jgi:ATP synthase protein I
MLANDARILIRSAVATAIAGTILIVVGAVTEGAKGALGGVFGVIVVAAFFTLSVVAVSFAGRRWGTSAMTAAALGTFVAKVLILLGLIAVFRGTTLFNTRFFGITAIVCILVWTAGEVVTVMRARIPYVVPAVTPGARTEGAGPEGRHVSGES